MFARNRKLIVLAVMLLVTALGFSALYHLTHEVHLKNLRDSLQAIPTHRLVLAAALTAISYFALTFYDVIALRIIGRPLPWRKAAVASFTSYTLSHNLGMSLVTGGSARYHVYSSVGLGSADVVRIVAIAGVAFWMGVVALLGISLIADQQTLNIAGLVLPHRMELAVGAAILLTIGGICLAGDGRRRHVGLFGWRMPLPGRRQRVVMTAVSVVDIVAAGGALLVLLPGIDAAAIPNFYAGYTLALVLALISHVPGGLGVFEATVIAVLPTENSSLLAALIVYRLIYYVVPLLITALFFAISEGYRRRTAIGTALRSSQSFAHEVAPLLMSGVVFAGGTILLVSGSLPGVEGRLRDLHGIFPLSIIEGSHIAASLIGGMLLLLAPGLYRRLDGAFHATRLLLVAGIAFSLTKGLDYEEAILLLGILALMQWTQPAFYRRTALTAEALSPAWIAAIATSLGLSLWVGIFAYKHVQFDSGLWWKFTLHADASRFLRASLAVSVLLAVLVWRRLLGPARTMGVAEAVPMVVAERALEITDSTDTMLAFTGDKKFLCAPEGDAFLMYQVSGSSWIVMGNPVGRKERWANLFWNIRTRAYAAQCRLVLYQITQDALPVAIDLGLQIIKYGETAYVDLKTFSLDGPKRRPLRYTMRRATKEGASFEVIARADLGTIIDELRAVSNDWLDAKGQDEKAFSLGHFDPAYLAGFDCAIVRQHGRVVAFANIWATPNRAELSVDLMRHHRDAPYGVMDFLFVQLMLWGAKQGYGRFSLGVAPLSGIEARRLSPLWAKLAAFFYRHGEPLYGFEGLRAYKDKFAPKWEARYIAGPHGLSLLHSFIDLQRLIGN